MAVRLRRGGSWRAAGRAGSTLVGGRPARRVAGARRVISGGLVEPESVETVFHKEDWYGDELTGRRFTRCEFREVDFTEASTRGVVFTDCVFGNVRFNASRHTDSAFTGCTFKRCNLFDAEFTGCKLVGSGFEQCTLRPLRVLGGDRPAGCHFPGCEDAGSGPDGRELRGRGVHRRRSLRRSAAQREVRERRAARQRSQRRRPVRCRAFRRDDLARAGHGSRDLTRAKCACLALSPRPAPPCGTGLRAAAAGRVLPGAGADVPRGGRGWGESLDGVAVGHGSGGDPGAGFAGRVAVAGCSARGVGPFGAWRAWMGNTRDWAGITRD
jgi:uncharacterized protein YjbI with pentapeptide repeats